MPRNARPIRTAVMVLATTLLVTAGTGCGPSPANGSASGGQRTFDPAGGRLRVLAADNMWGDIARQIGGQWVDVISILSDPNEDPHSYESSAANAAAAAHAGLIIENGLGYDSFITTLVGSGAPADARREELRIDRVVGVTGSDANPHLWYSPGYVTQGAAAIASALSRHDASHRADFAAGLQTFLASYEDYTATIATIRLRHAGTAIGYTERVAGYLTDAAGLVLATPAAFALAIEQGTEPGPGDQSAMNDAISKHRIHALLYNAQVTSPVTERVRRSAQSTAIPVVGVTETLVQGSTFQAWQTSQARALLAALGG